MKKPINKFAVTMWIFAGVVAILNTFEVWSIVENMRLVAREAGQAYLVTGTILRSIGAVIAPVVLLIGLGALIELVDQIRWDARPQQ